MTEIFSDFLREVETRDLAMALKGTKDDIKEKVAKIVTTYTVDKERVGK